MKKITNAYKLMKELSNAIEDTTCLEPVIATQKENVYDIFFIISKGDYYNCFLRFDGSKQESFLIYLLHNGEYVDWVDIRDYKNKTNVFIAVIRMLHFYKII